MKWLNNDTRYITFDNYAYNNRTFFYTLTTNRTSDVSVTGSRLIELDNDNSL